MTFKQALAKCHHAAALIEQAGCNGGDKETMLKAFRLYAAVAENPEIKMAEPYLGMACILASGGEYKDSLGCLNQAQKLEPANMRITQMRIHIERLMKKKSSVGLNSLATIERLESIRAPQPFTIDVIQAELDALLAILTTPEAELNEENL